MINILKTLLKNKNINEWESELKNEDFIQFLKEYRDDKGNCIYHLLFKFPKDKKDNLLFASELGQLLIDNHIPALVYNNDDKTPSQIANGKSIFAVNLKQQEEKENLLMHMEE